MFNIIFPIIIFVSLAIIVFIIGKHLPEFIDVKKNDQTNSTKKNYIKNFLKGFWGIIKNSLIWLVEKIIEKTKNLLTLIQSWIVDLRKGKREDDLPVKESHKNTENSKQDNFLDQITRKDKVENLDLSNKVSSKEEREDFFSKKEDSNQEKTGFFSKFKNNLKEKLLEKRRKKIDQVFQDDEQEQDNDQFSDGIIGIHKKPQNQKVEEGKLINEVVEVKKEKASSMSLDEEIGVDRHILEKKLINKIASNPKDKEIYRQLGELYLKMENYSDAENCYKFILKTNIRDIDAKRKIERIKLLKRRSHKRIRN